MRVMVLIKASAETEAVVMPSPELLTAMGAFNEELVKAGVMLAGDGLKPTSAGARVTFAKEGHRVEHGPFALDQGVVCGFWIWQVASLEEAIAWIRRCPKPMDGEPTIELRPVYEAEDFGELLTPDLREQEERLRQGIAARE